MSVRSMQQSLGRLAVVTLLVSGLLASSAELQQLRGQVINRDGAPQQCQVNFYLDGKLYYALSTDPNGYFTLTNPKQPATYRVEVIQGNRREVITVLIESNALRPATLVVPW